MRKFIIYSENAQTYPYIKNLKSAGRIDILLHSIISALFVSNKFREDTQLHLILMGPPNSPRHIIIQYDPENTLSKKNMKKTIEIALKKYKKNQTTKVLPGIFIDNKNIKEVVEDFLNNKKDIYFLNQNGKHIKNINNKNLDNSVFILGDHDGFDKQTHKYLRKNINRLSLGEKTYFTSQAITIINYEIDNK